MARQPDVRLFCSHGTALFFISRHPGCTVRDLAEALVVTERTVRGLIGSLRRAGLLVTRRQGRAHHYRIKEDAPFPDRTLSHLTVGRVFQALAN